MRGRRTRWIMAVLGLSLACLASPTAAMAGAADFGAGGWCWFQDPRGITHTGQHTRTYIGWITPAGDITVGSYDHGTGRNSSTVLHTAFETDDHASPALQVRPDGRIVAYYARHSAAPLYYRVTTNPEDISSWGPEQQITTNTAGRYGFTYPNPIRLANEGRTYLFWRGGSVKPTFSTQEDGAEAWAPARQLMSAGPTQRPYVKYASNGADTIHMAFTEGHPNETPEKSTNIHYARYRAGRLEQVDGDPIGPLGTTFAPAQADLVYDDARPAWVHDVAVGADGRPVIVFASFPDSLSRSGHIYHYARWTGTDWQVNEITAAGGSITTKTTPPRDSPLYSGGITLAHEDPARVYLSRQAGSAWWVEAWTTSDGGETWTSRNLTPGSTAKNLRPFSPRGAEPFGEMVMWIGGEYPDYRAIQTRVTGFIENPPPTFPPPPESTPTSGAGRSQQPPPAARDSRRARVVLPGRIRVGRRGIGVIAVRCRAVAGDRCLMTASLTRRGMRIGSFRGVVQSARRGSLRARLSRRALVALRPKRAFTARLSAVSVSRSGRRVRSHRAVRVAMVPRR